MPEAGRQGGRAARGGQIMEARVAVVEAVLALAWGPLPVAGLYPDFPHCADIGWEEMAGGKDGQGGTHDLSGRWGTLWWCLGDRRVAYSRGTGELVVYGERVHRISMSGDPVPVLRQALQR